MPEYIGISALAKLLYGFLLDRASLSHANGEDWLNEDGETFVHYPIAEIMERFKCGHDKAAALLQELECAGLFTRTLKNRGRPYRIVVQLFAMSPESRHPPYKEKRTADLEKTEVNKTENNKPDLNQTDSITLADRETVLKEIRDNISYDIIAEQIPQTLLDGVVDVIVDTICTTTPTVRIAGETVPREEVCRRFRALNQMDIYYVNDLLQREPGEIRYLRGYILARLYESPNFRNTYYERWADRDMNDALA